MTLPLLLDASVCLAGKQVRVGIYDLPPVSEMIHAGPNDAGRTQEASGLFPALLQAIAEKAEWDLTYVPCSRRECIERLDAGSLDLLVAAPYEKDLTRTYTHTRETVIPTGLRFTPTVSFPFNPGST
jgi:ABC-type amino acid transport substrate-binding protein